MRLFVALWICTILHESCKAHLSLRDEILQEKPEWIEPGRSKKFHGDEESVAVSLPLQNQPGNEAELRKALLKSEKQAGLCEAELIKLRLAADLNDNGKLDVNLVYLKKLVVALLNRLDGFGARKGKAAQIELFFSEKEKLQLRDSVSKLNQDSVALLVENMQDLINNAHVTYDNAERHSNFRQLYLDLCVIFRELDLFTAMQMSIVVCAVIFVYIAVTCRSKVITLSYLLVFGTWISYFWHWQNMLRKSQANRHYLSQNNPCEDTRSIFNPMRYFATNSKECESYMKKMFTPIFWDFTPMEVFGDMIATYVSSVMSVLIVNLMSAVGDAVREFSDKQSWFSILPAFAVLICVLLIVVFKLSGMGASLFYGALRLGPSRSEDTGQIIQPSTAYYRKLESCYAEKQLCWTQDAPKRIRKRKRKHVLNNGSDSETYMTAGEL